MLTNPNKHFWETTKGRVIALLRSGNRTVSEISKSLDLTANAVRAQLTGLERDGLVCQSGVRKGPRKPHTTYSLTPESGQLFPKAYGPILRVLFGILKQRIAKKQIEEIVRELGVQIAPNFGIVPLGQQPTPSEHALLVLHELGGFCEEVQSGDTKIALRCGDCPLTMVVASHPEACKLIETILSEVLGLTVKEQCSIGEIPRCMFEIVPR